MKVEPIYYGKKKVGKIINERVYVSHRSAKLHMFRGGQPTPASAMRKKTAYWGFNRDILQLLKDMNINIVAVYDMDKDKVYWTTLKKIFEYGKIWQHGEHGKQQFLNLIEWKEAESIRKLVDAVKKVA